MTTDTAERLRRAKEAFDRREWNEELAELARWTFQSMVLLDRPFKGRAEALVDAIHAEAEEIGATCAPGDISRSLGKVNVVSRNWRRRPTEVIFDVVVNGIPIVVSYHGEGMNADGKSYGNLGPKFFKASKAHFSLKPLATKEGGFDPDFAYDTAVSTMLVANALFRVSKPIAVTWFPSFMCIPADHFQILYDLLRTRFPPVTLWARTFSQESDTVRGVFSSGLMAFFGFELQILSDRVDVEDLRELLFSAAHAIFDREIPLQNGGYVEIGMAENPVRCRTVMAKSFILKNTEALNLFVEND